MSHDFSAVDRVTCAALERVFPAAQVVVLRAGQRQFAVAYGWLDPETRLRPVTADTLFDLASVTKLFTVTAFMALVEAGRVGLDQSVQTVLPEFSGRRSIQPYEDPLSLGQWVQVETGTASAEVDAGAVTFRHLLTHTSGLPAWRPLYREPSADAARRMARGMAAPATCPRRRARDDRWSSAASRRGKVKQLLTLCVFA